MTCVTSTSEVMKQPGESIVYAIDFTDVLRSDETISSITSVLEKDTSDLTISNKEVIAVETVVDELIIAVGKGIQFRVLGGNHGNDYRIQAIVVTNQSNIRNADVILKVRDR